MIKIYRKIRIYLVSRNLDQKIILLTLFVMVLISIITILATTLSSLNTITEKSRQLTQQQLATTSKNIELSLKDYDELMRLLVLEDYVQEYLLAEPEERGYASFTRDAFASILKIRNTKDNINYIAVVSGDENNYIYSGNSLKTSNFMDLVLEDYENAYRKEYGSMRYSVTRSIHDPESYSLNLYRPIYDRFILGKKVGLLCMSLDTASLTQFFQPGSTDLQLNISMTDEKGVILSSVATETLGKQHEYASSLTNKSGEFDVDGVMCMYNEISRWKFYLVGTVSLEYLLKDSYDTLLILILLVSILVIVSICFVKKYISKIYEPIRDIQANMKKVSHGDFSVRVSNNKMGEDLHQMIDSFNLMVVKLDELMIKVKEEQHQIEKIELNALQSQIKPHFLYNTLDCIHWQALVDGNEKVSTLVKALANYYRLCLSRGQDIICLSQELAHIENYLIIQNLRYGDIIESEWDIPENIQNTLMIPKMTLQPLVENCIYHGIKIKNGQRGTIKITAKIQDNKAIINVADSGSGVSEKEIEEINNSISVFDETFGYGVRNVHKRIEILFGKGYGLKYSKNKTGGLTVSIVLPYRFDED